MAYVTTTKDSFRRPADQPNYKDLQPRPRPTMVGADNIEELDRERPLPASVQDEFGYREPPPTKIEYVSTTQASFTQPELPADSSGPVHTNSQRLIGEVLKQGTDPRDQTSTQRSWLPGTDAGLRFRLEGMPTETESPSTGLDLTSSYEATHREHMLSTKANPHARVASITKQADPRLSSLQPGLRVYTDDP